MARVVIGLWRGPEMWASLPVVAAVTVRNSHPRNATDPFGGLPAANEATLSTSIRKRGRDIHITRSGVGVRRMEQLNSVIDGTSRV